MWLLTPLASFTPRATRLDPDPRIATPHDLTKVVYGPYYSLEGAQHSTEANTYYLFTPVNATNTPVVVEYHGGGFTGGGARHDYDTWIDSLLSNGIAFASMDYRLVATKYFYDGGAGAPLEEQFIHARADGTLTLDANGSVASDYRVRVGRQEFNTKCSFDAAAGFDDLLTRAAAHGLDPHRVAFTGSSAGGGEIHYLSWVWPALNENWKRFTPVAMVYTNAQLDYPVQNMLSSVWGLWAGAVGGGTRLTEILAHTEADCEMVVGNPWCEADKEKKSEEALCNQSWHDATMARFCGAAMAGATLDDLVGAQAWPNATDHERGIATLWLNSRNLLAYRKRADVPKTPFYLYVANRLNGTAGMNVVHNALYARLYHELAVEAGINATSYYTDYAAMRPTDRSPTRLDTADGVTYNYKSTLDWRGAAGVAATEPASANEQLLWLCLAFGVRCDAGPAPPPPPPPVPLSDACKAEIRAVCAVAPAACGSCVHHHSGELIAHGCPRKGVPGAAEACIEYCESEGEVRRGGERS